MSIEPINFHSLSRPFTACFIQSVSKMLANTRPTPPFTLALSLYIHLNILRAYVGATSKTSFPTLLKKAYIHTEKTPAYAT